MWNWVGMYVIGRSLVKKRDRWAVEREVEDFNCVNRDVDSTEDGFDRLNIEYHAEEQEAEGLRYLWNHDDRLTER